MFGSNTIRICDGMNEQVLINVGVKWIATESKNGRYNYDKSNIATLAVYEYNAPRTGWQLTSFVRAYTQNKAIKLMQNFAYNV